MKKNGYLRRFLALFLALVMIMADSSVTTFAATVGRVKQKSAAAETENQQTVYTYEDSKVTVTATLENADAVPDNAKFVVTKMNKADHQDGYAYAEQKLKEYEELENVLYDSYLIYDMHFEDENGNEIEPAESQVSVNISYKKAQKLSNETTEDSVQVLHLDENLDQLEDVTDNVELNKKGKIKEVTLTTDSFSTFIIADQGLSSFKLRLQFVDSQGNVATSQNGTYYAKIEKDGLHQFKKITVENGIGEATFDALYDNNGNRQKSIETGEYKAVLAIARPDQNPNVEGQKQNNWDTNNALSEVDNGQTFDYQFTIAINDRYTVDSSHDTVVINATQMGNNSISYADIKDGLKDASQFMVVANYFEQSMHFEGNFAVDKFKGNGNPVGAQGTEKKINLTINIEKSVNPAAAKTFNFRIVDANKNKVADVTITTDANGVGSTSYTIKDAKSAYEVYELDEKGNILEDGGKIGDYTVSYDYSEGLKGLMNYDTTSFAKVIEGVTSLTANSSNNLFVTTSEVTTDKGAVKKVTAAEFDSLINITNILTTVSGLSKKLAKAKSTDSAQVVYLTPSDLKQHRLNLPAVRDNQALVINVMIPSGMNELDVATEVLYVGNEIVDVAGKKESELDPNSKGQQIAKRTIWNFVNEDGTPYKGYVKDTGKKMGGFALVPEGSYMNNNGMCSIYAKNVYQGGAEIHKNSFPGDQEKSGTVKISNRKDTPEETSVSVKKVWNDSNNQDGIRPAKLTVNLMNGNTVVSTVTLSEENGWEATVSNLPKKENGTVISYSWSEGSMPEGYSLEGSVTSGTVTTLTNKYAPEETSVSVRKVWTDSDNQDGIRPDSITVQLKADGKESGEPVELNEANNWTHTWNGLAKKASGTEIEYSVDEVSVPGGYTKTVTANENKTEYTITNTHETEKTEATVKKVWNDSNNQDGTRPVELTVNLMNGNAVVDTVTLKEANDWSATVGNLEKKAGGKDIEYTWTEGSMPEGYKLTDTRKNGTVTTLTNTYAPEKVSITGTKTWNDANNQDGKRPTSIKISLFANGNVVKSLDVTAATNWTYSFTDLPKYEAGTEIKYTVGEEAVADYETKVEGYNITNTHKPATLDITGTKTWNDSNNQDGKRSKSITVNLLANGRITDTKTVTADDNWTYSFTDLPKYANGQEITYTVSELTVPGYTTTIDDNYNITNSYTPGETSASVTKIWDDADNQDGIRPESITVALLANGTPTNKTVTLTAANNWTQTITGLPEKADGEYITYTWTEVNVPEGYSLTGTSKNETVTTLTNTHTPELTSITGTKTWKDADNQDGKRPESITVNLFADGTKLKSQSVSADADGNWSYSFTDLPKYANGQEITYTVTEDAVDGYTTESDGYNFINTHQPETTEITGTKTWNDANNQDGKRPESITVILLANGTEKTRQAVTADEVGNWTYTFKDLPKYANGQEITYTVAEEEVTDYTTTYDGSNITNSYTPGKTSATVTKIWNDAENQDGKRPESITVSLLADGKETGKTVTLSVENNWKQTISDLPEKADGKAIEYTWTEETLPEGYELTDNSKNGTVTTLTNTYAPETTSITVTKTWDDADNQDGKRPESIIVNLLANGEIVASQTVKADEAGNWTYTFKDLPKYANGKEITYTVTEEAVEGYETSVDGFNITNTYTTETTEVKGSKTWNDADNQDGKRPESITVRLLANGEEKDSQTVTADENGNWTYSFEKLPKYEAGKEIVYTVTEDAVADYTTEITGYDITNSYAPGKTSVTVTKAWADNDDRGGHRPKEIKVQLKADGENSGEEIILNAENKWTYTWSELDEKKAGKDIVYTVEEIGKIAGYISTVTGNATEGFIITNTITSVKISKVDITDQKELAGAHIQILDKDGNVVDEWDSTWESHEVTGLKTGEKYTLRETVAPDGYTITADTVFSLKEDGTLDKDNTSTTISADGTLLVEDSRTSVKVSKVDISDGKELEGAHIQIIDQDGNVVDEWDSTKEAHVTEKLKTGKIYTLRETVAPDGYLLTSDTTFVLKEDGTVDAEKTTAVSKDGVLLVQDKLATSASIAVTKKLTYIGEGLAARNQTFYVALYSDKECTQRVSDVKALVFKNADASTVVFSENIKAGKTYYIAECTQDGTSQTIGALADGTVYEAVFGNGNSTTVTEADGTTTVSFENVFSSFPPDGFYKQGQLTITKKVLGADGGTRNSNEVFYAGIFDDAAHTQLSQQVEQNIIKLDMAGGYEVSEIINVGLAQSGAKVTLYVTETDSNGKPIAGSEGFGYKVTVSADSVTFDETNMTAEVVITNQEESTVTETPTPTPTPSSDGGNSGGSEDHSGGYGGGKSPKTGDDTPIGTYLMLLLAAAMLAAETERRRRRNKRQ